MVLKIGVYGSAAGDIPIETMRKAREIGAEIARMGHVVITGACNGLPYEAVLGAHECGGKVIGYSSAANLDDHIRFKLPVAGFTSFVFVPSDYQHSDDQGVCKKYRNVSSVADSDAVIIIGGRIGTMNEFTNAYDCVKNIGILEGSGGITKRAIKILLEDASKESAARIVWDPDPAQLVRRLAGLSE
jgi:predicted Rossmann-fold nucleotide-binding protein